MLIVAHTYSNNSFGIFLQFSMNSVKEELHSDNEDCPVFSSFEEVSFVVKRELLSIPETLLPTEKMDMVRYRLS
jgi:hypothetical protein